MASSSLETEPVSAKWVVSAISGLVVLTVGIVLGASGGASRPPVEPAFLASLNAGLNGMATLCLVAGFAAIRSRRVAIHRACMLAAFGLSTVFLMTYLWHHAAVGSVAFGRHGLLRVLYFVVLVPHILLAALIVPLALLTVYRAWTGRIALHRRVARWTLPVWLYVSASGVLVYWMLYYL